MSEDLSDIKSDSPNIYLVSFVFPFQSIFSGTFYIFKADSFLVQNYPPQES